MRIVAGAARGRRLGAPPGRDVRPTADRVKEALFSSLQARLPGARVLDLYAGAGGLGLEALSRGAASVTFVERARPALDALAHNLEVVALPGAHVVPTEVAVALRTPPPGSPFDLVLADPPYALSDDALAGVLTALVGHLATDAVVVAERSVRSDPPSWPRGLLAEAPRGYGDIVLHRATWTSVSTSARPAQHEERG